MDSQIRRRWLILVAVAIGLFMALVDASIVNIATPAIMSDLGASVSQVSWVLDAYNLGLAVLILAAGTVADRFGQRRVFIAGLLIFTGFSLACGLAPSIGWLIAFRAAQSVGAAAIIPVSLIVLTRAFPREKYGVAVGIWGAVGILGAACGPSLGGLIIEYLSWPWIFLVNLPIGVLALVMTAVYVSEHREPVKGRFDWLGLSGSAVGLSCLTLALIQGNDWGWSSTTISGLLAIAAIVMMLWVVWELRAANPLVDLRLFRIREFAAANLSLLAIGIAMMGALFLLIQLMVTLLGYTELRAAVSVTAMPLGAALVAAIAGRFVDRFSPRWFVVVGMTSVACGLFLLTQLGASAGWWDITWRVAIIGIGMGLAMPSLSAGGVSCLPEEKTATGSSVINWSRQIGYVVGIAVLVAVFSHAMTSELNGAVADAKVAVAKQTALPAKTRTAIGTGITDIVAAAQKSGQTPSLDGLQKQLAASAPRDAASSTAITRLVADLKNGFTDARFNAFYWPFMVAALIALLGALPGFAFGRRRTAIAARPETELPGADACPAPE